MFSKLGKALSGAYSDHAPQLIQVLQRGTTSEQRFRLATWNLLNRCQDRAHCHIKNPDRKYSNNPVDEHETSGVYLQRKTEELIKIIQMIDENKLDVFFLQEPDILCKPPEEIFDDEFTIRAIYELRTEFYESLDMRGWACAQTERGQRVQMLATLINTKRFDIPSLAVSPLFMSSYRRNRAASIEVRDRSSGLSFELVNLHLDPRKDYSQDILDYMYPRIHDGVGVLMGGDMNHTIRTMPIKVGPSAIASATNAKGIAAGIEGEPHPPNAIDSFLASPSSAKHSIRPDIYWGEEFINEKCKTLLQSYKGVPSDSQGHIGHPMLDSGLLRRLLRCPYNSFGAPILEHIHHPETASSPASLSLTA